MSDFTRALQQRDLSARSQVGRFTDLHVQEDWFQTTLPVAPVALPATNDRPEVCGHAGTGRAAQRRLFGAGWMTVCVRCGQEVT